jgi:hypothetical protein
MILFYLTNAEAEALDAALVGHPTLRAQLASFRADRLTSGHGAARTVILRDEGDDLPWLMVSYDRPEDADREWLRLTAIEEEITWPT